MRTSSLDHIKTSKIYFVWIREGIVVALGFGTGGVFRFFFFSERLSLHLNGNHFQLPNISVQAALSSEKHFMLYTLKNSIWDVYSQVLHPQPASKRGSTKPDGVLRKGTLLVCLPASFAGLWVNLLYTQPNLGKYKPGLSQKLNAHFSRVLCHGSMVSAENDS